MKKYIIQDAINLFQNAGLNLIHIEGLDISLVNRKKLEKVGKIKKGATYGEMDIFVFYRKTIFLVEFTAEKNINTKDFDNFLLKTNLLLENNAEKLKLFIKQLKEKYANSDQELKKIRIDKVGNYKIKALYINPTLKCRDENTLKERIPKRISEAIYVWGRDTFEYFRIICNTLRKYSKYELFSYFEIDPKYIFDIKELYERTNSSPIKNFMCIEKGIYGASMYTFKIKPNLLLERTYVLRNEGWKSDSFQRMIIPFKLVNIRNYILEYKNTQFANNIILSLNPEINKKGIIKNDSIDLPYQFGSLCIIDGQHRLLAFTQDFCSEKNNKEETNDKKINSLSRKSELLVTLIIFDGSEKNIQKKQTQLFIDINSNQTKIKTDFLYNLKEITEIKNPLSVGNKVVKYLSLMENGIFEDKIEVKSYDTGKIKRSSIVTYGLSELVDNDKNFLFPLMSKNIRREFLNENVEEYVLFCAKKLNKYFKIIKIVFEKKLNKKVIWDTWRKSNYMLCSTSGIVGFLRLYRHFIKSKIKNSEISKYIEKIDVDFRHESYLYTSSQWAKLESAMFYSIRENGFPNFGDETLIPKKHRKVSR